MRFNTYLTEVKSSDKELKDIKFKIKLYKNCIKNCEVNDKEDERDLAFFKRGLLRYEKKLKGVK